MAGFLTTAQVEAYKRMHKAEKQKQPCDKIKAILMLNQGYSCQQVADILLLDMTTIWRWHQLYTDEGIKGLLKDNYIGGTCKLTEEQLKRFVQHLESNVYLTAKEICAYVEKSFGVEYTPKGMTSLLHSLNFAYKKPKHIPGKANSKAQQEFIDRYEHLKNTMSGEDKIYFVDGVHPLHNSQPAYGWIKKGQEMVIQANTGRQRINLNGAYCIADHSAVIHEAEMINAQSTIALFKEVMRQQPLGFIYIILDNARYYRAEMVTEFVSRNHRIRLMFLPPYSPNLNVIERLWRFFKKNVTYNTYYEEFSVFRKYCLNFFKNLKKYRPQLESLMTDNFEVIQA
jgi:transposase